MQKEIVFYSARDALVELKRRQKTDLKEKVELWWKEEGCKKPDFLPKNGDCWGILPRQIATARIEDLIFYNKTKKTGIIPVWLEHTEDKFSSSSSYKKSLVCLPVKQGNGNGDTLLKLSSVKAGNGKKLSEIELGNNHGNGIKNIVEFHHNLQDKILGQITRYNVSDWFAEFGNANSYYLSFLSLFLSHAILFENFCGEQYEDESEKDFDEGVFKPAYEKIYELFGLAPLIVSFPWKQEMGFYPGKAFFPKNKETICSYSLLNKFFICQQ